MTDLTGTCLCGAVTVAVRAERPGISLCHCDPCRKWSGTALAGFDAEAADVTVSGPATSYPSSDFAERAFCPTCGTHLWFRDTEAGAPYELSPGLFAQSRDWPLDREVYADRVAAYLPLGGSHRRITRAEYERDHQFVEGDPS